MTKFEEYIFSTLPIKRELTEIFSKKSPLIIFDIGACEGEDSIRYSLLFNNATIYSFEPLPENYEKCVQNIKKLQLTSIKPFQIALSKSDGFVKFYVSSGNPEGINTDWDYGNKSSSLYAPDKHLSKYEWIKFERVIDVETVTIDNFCTKHEIPNIDFIHLDVQGAELDVLMGGCKMLPALKAIWLEVENITFYKNQPLRTDIENFMKNEGFIKITDTAYEDSGDQLYVNSLYYSPFNLYVLKFRFICYLKRVYYYLRKYFN